jgi:tetratricopeptide (TPR) repeat protein
LHPFLRARGPAGRHLEILDAAIDAVRSRGDLELTARLSVARGEAWRHFGDIAPALRDLDEALGLARTGAWRDVEGECLYQRATALWLEGRHLDANGDAKAALALFRQNGDRAREGLVLSLLGVVEQALGRFAEARRQHEAALEIYRGLGHRRAEGLEHNRLAHLAYRTGRGKDNRVNLARALEALRDAGDRINEALCTHNLGYQLLEEDEVAEAVGHIETALATYRELGVRRNEGAALAHLAAARLNEGEIGPAAALFEEALAIHSSVGDRHTESFTLRHYARLSIERGDWDEADRLLARGLEAARASSNTQAEGFLLAYRAATCAMLGDIAEAGELLAAARTLGELYRGLRLPDAIAIVEGCVDLARARELEAQGGEGEARSLRERAAALAKPVNEPSSVLRHTRRVLLRAIEAQSSLRPHPAVRPASDAFSIRLSADGRKVTLAEQPTVDLARRRAQRSILHRLISHREASPGDALPWGELFEAGWPGERVQVDAGFGRVRTTIWALRKLGLHAVLITRDDGYLLDPRVEIVREAS